MRCKFSKELLMAWMDGEASHRDAQVRAHLEGCSECQNDVASWRDNSAALTNLLDEQLGEVEPLLGLQKIRARIAAAERETLRYRWSRFWQDVTMFHRKQLAGVALALGLGAVTAPLAVWWLQATPISADSPRTVAGVMVESLEVQGDTKAVVYQAQGSTTTLIWVEPQHGDTREMELR